MNEIYEKIHATGIIPVIAIDDAEKAVPLANALKEGGLPCAEVTFRTACAEQAIRNITENVPDMLVGAGTVLTTEQVDRAVDAGAKFIVSPGLNPKVVAYCVSKNIPIVPGCANPSDIEAAIELGLSVVKFFPAEAAGGLNMIKAMSAPYGNIKFMPTGGIGENNPQYREVIAKNIEFMGAKIDCDKNNAAKRTSDENNVSAADSKIQILVIPTNEELMIAKDTMELCQ